jgi:hypothetical protein
VLLVLRLTELNAEQLKLETRRAGLEVELAAARRDGALELSVEVLADRHRSVQARLAEIEASREDLDARLREATAPG